MKKNQITRLIKNEWNSKNTLRRLNLGLVALATIVCVSGGVKIISSKILKPSQAKISLTYQSASDGLNPNGTRFNAYEMVSDEVLKKASKSLGYNINKDDIWVGLPQSTDNSSNTTDYYLYYKGKHGSDVLKAVLDAWSDTFEAEHTSNADSAEFKSPEENTDFIYSTKWYENQIQEIASYAKSHLKKENKWKNSDNVNYQTVYDEAQNLIDVDLNNLKTYIIQNGVSMDNSSLKNATEYKDRLLQMKKDNHDAQYNNRREAISLYDPTLFPTISVPSISSGTYYITTTKTGLDYIYDAASVASGNSLDVQKQISEDQLIVSKMGNISSEESIKKAKNMSKSIEKKITKLGKKLKTIDNEYKETQEEPYYRLLVNGQEYTGN